MADLSASGSPVLPKLGSYQILRPLGSGGMSNVFQAVHRETGSVVALKVLPRNLAQNPVLLQRFLKEAKSAEALDHPNIVAIYDRGNDEGRHYLVLEFVDGRDLFDQVRGQGPMDSTQVIALVQQVAEGLRYAAQRGMVHRDIKPANLLLTTQGQAKIIDLGLALQTLEEDERVTRQGTTVGTVDYMSPEQARDSRKISVLSDIYSLGCTLFYLVTGTAPFAGGTLADKLARHHSAPIPNARDRNPNVPVELAGLIEQMMAKQPADRPSSYDDLLGQLHRIAQGQPRLAAPAPMDVLIDDEDDSDDAIELTIAAPPKTSPTASPASKSRAGAASNPSAASKSSTPEFSLADLAAIDAEEPSGSRPARRRPASTPTIAAVQEALLEGDENDLVPSGIRRPGPELPLKTWVIAGIGVGLAIALVGVGLNFVLSALRGDPSAPSSSDTVVALGPPSAGPTTIEPETEAAVAAPLPSNRGATKGTAASGPATTASREVQPTTPRPPVAMMVRPENLADFGVTPFEAEAIPAGITPIIVRRFDEPGDQVTDSLATALDRPGSVVEIADAGPVREDHFDMTGKTKIIRGRGDHQPILRIDTDFQAAAGNGEAKFLLGGTGVERLILQDLDLIVDVRDLPPNQSTLFRCQGAELSFIHCTITLHNLVDRDAFSLVRTVNGPRPNRVRFDRCLVRGPIRLLADLQSDQCEVDIRRSVIVGAGNALVQLGNASRPHRTLRTISSVIYTTGSLIDNGGRRDRLTWRSLGSALIHGDRINAGLWLSNRGAKGRDDLAWLDYDGGGNRWIGWTAPPSLPQASAVNKVEGTTAKDARRSTFADGNEPQPFPLTYQGERTTALDFQSAFSGEQIDLASVAVPGPWIYEETVDRFPKLLNPDGVEQWPQPAVIDPRPIVGLTFDPRTSPDDLGVFLTRQVTDRTKRYEVRLNSTGTLPVTPIRLADGLAATIIGPAAGSPTAPICQLTPNQAADALLSAGRTDLRLENLGILIDETKPNMAALAVDGGSLSLRQCSVRSKGDDTERSPLIRMGEAQAAGPDPGGPPRPKASAPLLALENSWVWTNRPAIALDLRQGSCLLKNCVVLAGRSAFVLRTPDRPGESPDLMADLSLENCTVLAERSDVDAADLGSATQRSTRPFLVWSRNCVFPRSWRDQGALLALDRERFALGNLFWDSFNDLYDVSRFLADARAEAGPTLPADLRRQWVEVWGGTHAHANRGPDQRRVERLIQFRDNLRPRATRPNINQLELDPKIHRKQGADFSLLPARPRA